MVAKVKLSLPDVTLLALDTTPQVHRAICALVRSAQLVEFARVVLVTDVAKRNVSRICALNDIEVIDQPSVLGKRAYETQQLTLLHGWFETPFVLFQEWDAGVLNPEAWNPSWLECDYIGAPWPFLNNSVGNGGFSIRSKKWCELIARQVDRESPAVMSSDTYACLELAPSLDLNIASFEEANRFSCEETIYANQFGFHGIGTVRKNNWNIQEPKWLKT